MPTPPSGTVTFLFTDIEGSARRWDEQPEAMKDDLARHDTALRGALERHGGHVFKTVGDAFHAAFARPEDALRAAVDGQRALAAEGWGGAVRMALHTGTAVERDGDYFGPTLNRVARLLAAGHGGQLLLSSAVQELVRGHLPDATELRDLGEHRLKDLTRPEHIFQLAAWGLPVEFPPLRTLDAGRNNLPVQATRLVGREKELAALRERLLDPATQLLTLTGPGGTGKTRLALQAAAELVDAFADGVVLVPLASISDPALVLPTIARTLGVTESAGQALLDRVRDHLREKRLLLVLDNFEQVAEAAPAIAEVLAACPRLAVLVTSRAVLRVYGEREVPVSPLALPDQERLPTPSALSQYAAAALFIERAQAVKPDFAVTDANAPAVAEICHRLDGLPLAIELAAARVRILTPEAMLGRLEHRLSLLTGGARTLPARQQTLRDTISWSHDLLTPAERALFRRLAVFVGGCTLEAVEAICAAAGDLGLDVLDGLASLAEKSLVRQEELEGEARVTMLETIREFAREQLLASFEAAVVRDAHLAYIRGMAEEAEMAFRGAGRLAFVNRVAREHDNVRAALTWSLAEPGRAAEGLFIAVALYWYWQLRGHHSEARRWLADLALAAPDATPALHARALANAGAHAFFQTDLATARSRLDDGVALGRASGDRWALAWALQWRAMATAFTGGGAARADAEESAALYRALGDDWNLSSGLYVLGVAAFREGDRTTARAVLEETIAIKERLGDRWTAASAYGVLGRMAYADGEYPRARALLEESVARMREIDDQPGLAIFVDVLGSVMRALGDRHWAVALFQESLRLSRSIGRVQGIALGLVRLATVAAADGDDALAARLCEAAEALPEPVRAQMPPFERGEFERCVAAVRGRAEASIGATTSVVHAALSMDEACDEALRIDAGGDRSGAL